MNLACLTLGRYDGLYVEDHSEGFDACLNRDLSCCCLNSTFMTC